MRVRKHTNGEADPGSSAPPTPLRHMGAPPPPPGICVLPSRQPAAVTAVGTRGVRGWGGSPPQLPGLQLGPHPGSARLLPLPILLPSPDRGPCPLYVRLSPGLGSAPRKPPPSGAGGSLA